MSSTFAEGEADRYLFWWKSGSVSVSGAVFLRGLTPQNVGDFEVGGNRGILGNSDFVYLLNQNAKSGNPCNKLGLSEKQLAYVTNSGRGGAD